MYEKGIDEFLGFHTKHALSNHFVKNTNLQQIKIQLGIILEVL